MWRLPLAIRLIAGRLRHHRDELLADVASDFADQTPALDALVAEHLSVRAAFEWSYRLLTDEQRRAFRLLGWHPGPEITQVVIAAMADASPAGESGCCASWSTTTCWTSFPPRASPAVRMTHARPNASLCRERADAEEPPTERAAAVDRLAGSYLSITHAVDRSLRPDVRATLVTKQLRALCWRLLMHRRLVLG